MSFTSNFQKKTLHETGFDLTYKRRSNFKLDFFIKLLYLKVLYEMQSTFSNHTNPNGISMTPSMHDIETAEEMEDRILFGRAANMFNSPAVHFKSR